MNDEAVFEVCFGSNQEVFSAHIILRFKPDYACALAAFISL